MSLSDHLDRIQQVCAKATQQHNGPFENIFRSGLLANQEYRAGYDLIVDEAPTSPNAKAETWAALLPLFPTLAKLGAPVDVWLELFRYSPVPASTVDKIRETFAQIQQQQAQQPPSPDPALVKAQAQVQAQQAKTQSDIAADQARAQNDIQIAQVKAQADIELQRQKAADKARTDFAAMLQRSVTGAIPIQ